MATYEEDHNISRPAPRERVNDGERPTLLHLNPQLNEFFGSGAANPSATIPNEAYREFGRALMEMGSSEILEELTSQLFEDALHPPSANEGVSQQFLDSLERIPKKKLKRDDSCAICSTQYLDDKYPLVVKLPCNDLHHFDLECIGPWLKLHATCPLCRKNLLEKKKPLVVEDDEEPWDDTFG